MKDTRTVLLERMTEAEFQKQVLEWARRGNWLCHHTHDSRFQEWGTDRGFPDLVLVRPPRVLFVELKREKGNVTSNQALWIFKLENCPGIEAYIWRPTDGDEVKRVLNVTSAQCQGNVTPK